MLGSGCPFTSCVPHDAKVKAIAVQEIMRGFAAVGRGQRVHVSGASVGAARQGERSEAVSHRTNQPYTARAIVSLRAGTLFQPLDVYVVFADELPEGTPILAGGARGLADVALAGEQELLYVGALELRDEAGFRFLERSRLRDVVAERQAEMLRPGELLRTEREGAHEDVLQ